MKTRYLFLLALIAATCIQVFADVVTTTRRINSSTTPKNQSSEQIVKKEISAQERIAQNIKMCKPYSETLNTDVSGINFSFNIKINGWVNDKCQLDFSAKSTGINELFSSIYGVDSSNAIITTFEPKVKCSFTKEQLEYVGDSILQEEERDNGTVNNMLKNPNDIDLSSFGALSESDNKLMNVLLNDRACRIQNVQDSGNLLDSLFSF